MTIPAIILVLALTVAAAWRLKRRPRIAAVPASPVPPGFLWGVSSSGFQSEGGPVNSVWTAFNAASADQDRYGTSVDFRRRYREDVSLASDLGVNTFRIGIQWARVEPRRGEFDEAELGYYDDLTLSLKEAGIAPLITLDHFDYPAWVGDRGGWTNSDTVTDFVRYADTIAARYARDVTLWITFNEQMASILGQPKLGKARWRDILRVRRHVVAAHRQTYDVIHRRVEGATVTSNIFWLGDRFMSGPFRRFGDWLFLDKIADKCDVIAIDYYFADLRKALKAGSELWKTPPEPAGLYRALRLMHRKYPGKPLLVAEAGMSTRDGQPREDGVTREDVLRDGVYWTQRARDDGMDVIGFLVWSLTDNFEWGSYTPRFGLYTVDVLRDPTLRRMPTAAVPAYKEIIRDNGVPVDYRPALPQ